MPPLWLIRKTLAHQRRQTLAMLAAAALATAVVVGSLATGDSMDHTLREQALDRAGRAEVALIGNDRLFRPELADDIVAEAQTAGRTVEGTAAFMTFGSASTPAGTARANQTQVIGIEKGFGAFAPSGEFPSEALDDNSGNETPAAINDILAERLGVAAGDSLVLRLRDPSELSADAPMAEVAAPPRPMRLRIQAVVGPDRYGRFSVFHDPRPQPLIFIRRDDLSNALEEPDLANLLLLRATEGEALQTEDAYGWLDKSWRLPDLALELERIEALDQWELSSRRVFIGEPLIEGVREAVDGAVPVLTYFVNAITHGEKSTPFSFVAGINPDAAGFLPDDMPDDRIAVNQWLADDLGLRGGETVELGYYLTAETGGLVERTTSLQVGTILPMKGPALDPAWMPDFPGLSTAEDCDDWETSLPIEVSAIRPRDEDYWDTYRGAPKGFITLEKAQELWSNRWGEATAIRLPGSLEEVEVREQLRRTLSPSDVGLFFSPFRERALAASRASVDFGGLMIGFGFFVIAAALGLVGLLFAMGVDQRADQIGLLKATGWRPRQVRNLLLGEGLFMATVAALIGIPAGILLARGLVAWIDWIWPSGAGGLGLEFSVTPLSILLGLIAGILMPLLTLGWTISKTGKYPIVRLLAGETPSRNERADGRTRNRGKPGKPRATRWWIATLVLALGSVAGLAWALGNPMAPGAFFAGAFLLVLTGLAGFRALLARVSEARGDAFETNRLALREAARNPWRSLTVAGTLAAGTFLVVASAAFRKGMPETHSPEGPTGGFELLAGSTGPITDKLERADLPDGTVVVGLRRAEGSDASCLNLGSVQQPQLLGVDPADLQGRFSFASAQGGTTWETLLASPDDPAKAAPAIVDQTTLLWSLKTGIGSKMTVDDEEGRPFDVVFAGALDPSILQGGLLLAEATLLEHFPSLAGDRLFLIDLPEGTDLEAALASINRSYGDEGVETRPTLDVLADYNAIENTYIAMFQVLGGFGILLATAGIGLVAARNLQERSRQYALLLVLGWRRTQVRRLATRELLLSAGCGLFGGLVASALAVWPQLNTRGGTAGLSWLLLAGLVLAIALGSAIAVSVAVRSRLRNLEAGELSKEE